ncbi:hypothetical protein BBH51_04140 [Aggregatibacter actinomycetemcomitans]|uniref:PAAR domain-containing protein n=2 Tax=Aggregatibacter actinomycetemcomitans TaxID=714 RepID=A0A142FZF1_AGGAC|nr:PAAR domain-containing protein [Aggregatibacter actinomycetemcomitans]AMQ93781.1 hypothetical protein ACT75_04205 [Aggregatibacter actinomycetemcomitans]ANU81898.1 hypothetical protein BBH51_04140 [Aggregatibacter actinomycetemcomitans]EKX93627.1 hypothetical protein HMPREF9996_02191 [Aggregatibacter actinomycetemcomitans Y4]KND83219.1 membrane protein [Aggregatibacter actinomycetemcomitans serotype a str. H5P1]KOE31289.1 membrane protein [Aggregatibacter actinomycetemcomitans D17P-3]
MAKLRAIVFGDKTTHGGLVLQGSHSTAEGKPISLEGDLVACPKCKGSFPIVEGTSKMNSNGRRVALEGMKTACGAELIGSQRLVWVEHDAQNYQAGISDSRKAFSGKSDESENVYKVQFHFTNDEGEPYSNKSFIYLMKLKKVLLMKMAPPQYFIIIVRVKLKCI